MLINIRLSDGILEIVEPGFDARVEPPRVSWRVFYL